MSKEQVKEKCAKCKDETDSGRCRTSGGKSFVFCKFCDAFLQDHPNISIRDYLGPGFDTWVSKNIQEAHKRRMKGESPWRSLRKEGDDKGQDHGSRKR